MSERRVVVMTRIQPDCTGEAQAPGAVVPVSQTLLEFTGAAEAQSMEFDRVFANTDLQNL